MYTKEQLEQMAIPELMEVAAQIGVKVKQDDDLEKVIYDILDKAAIDSAADIETPGKRKRTRITKKEKAAAEQPQEPVAETATPAPKKRGRKSKAEKALEAAALQNETEASEPKPAVGKEKKGRGKTAKKAAEKEESAPASEEMADNFPDESADLQVPEAAVGAYQSDVNLSDQELLQQLQEKMNLHNQPVSSMELF